MSLSLLRGDGGVKKIHKRLFGVLWHKFLAFFYRGRKQSNLSSFKIGCKGTTKIAHTQIKRTLFSKKIDSSIKIITSYGSVRACP